MFHRVGPWRRQGDFYWEYTIHTYYHKFDKQEVSSFTGGAINFRDYYGSSSFGAEIQSAREIYEACFNKTSPELADGGGLTLSSVSRYTP